MKVIELVKLSNKYLAGEQLTYGKLLPFFDAVIDDINAELNATYPSFTDLEIHGNPSSDDSYDFFPDRYLRSVVAIGAAVKFYEMDEEGELVAQNYAMKYQEGLFLMTRDFIERVPHIYQSDSTGGVMVHDDIKFQRTPFNFHIWR